MARLRDHGGLACLLEAAFFEKKAASPPAGGAADACETATADLSSPVARITVRPDVICGDHLQDLAYAVVRDRPDLEGADLPVGIECLDDHPLVPMLIAKESCSPSWEEATLAAASPMHIETIDRAPLAKFLQKQGLDPAKLLFTLKPIPAPASPAPRASGGFALSRASDTGDGEQHGDWITVRVPSYPRTAEASNDQYAELLPSHAGDHWMRVGVHRDLLAQLVRDEAAYAKVAGDAWTERAWFLAGDLVRDGGQITARVRALCPATDVHASVADVVFGPQTWVRARHEMDARGLVLLGWVHTHSIARLRTVAQRKKAAPTAAAAISQPATGIGDATAESDLDGALADLKSGLFLSQTDVDSAHRLGFRAPTALTAVLDADECVKADEPRTDDLGTIIGFWGWAYGSLARRSVRVITGD
jgi:hypothetical protein